MRVFFVGGAQGVGASCLAVEIGGQWIVVDAGVRVDRKSDPLPDLALLEEKDVRAIFVTHAHADHIGALPLVHQAFPLAPIFASRATSMLMEVMLADALKIMNRRAAEEMEIPLYPPELVGNMLNRVRPLPVGETLTLPQIPGVSIHASRAGHIAGAISLCLTAHDGTLVVSGDISITPQRTVQGAAVPPINRCDLLVLESTYGARFHPNREGEESRMAHSIAERITSGGHVLIPCFGLGRGQEILLLLLDAQRKGSIPEFSIYVDGLVRRVCSIYQFLPEALSPTLQRQIRKGYQPFAGRNVSFVRDERHREQILAGPPACILSSSGMLTGGPSVWYAQRLAPQASAAIFASGYTDEESPGRRLLDLAEQQTKQLELNGIIVNVACHVAKFSLSAHADGGELVAYAAALKPRQVALVHGDEEARRALGRLLQNTEVLLPDNGAEITTRAGNRGGRTAGDKVRVLASLPVGIGQGRELTSGSLPELWQAVSQVPSLSVVTARELASVWYGQGDEETTGKVLQCLRADYEGRYFVQQSALEEAFRIRGQGTEDSAEGLNSLLDHILLLQVSDGLYKPVLCLGIEPGNRIRILPSSGREGEHFLRTRYPSSAIIDVLGVAPPDYQTNHTLAADGLETLIKAARQVRRRISAHRLASRCQEGTRYKLADLCHLAGVSATVLADRLAVAKVVLRHPRLFVWHQASLKQKETTLYALAPEWAEALMEPEDLPRPDQRRIQEIIEQHLGGAPDLYRRGVDPMTGNITLAFHFPTVAQKRYAEQLAAIAAETNVSVTLTPRPHQAELINVARRLLPASLVQHGEPSLYHDQQVLLVKCRGEIAPEVAREVQQTFADETGWHLRLQCLDAPSARLQPSLPQNARQDQATALQTAQQLLRGLPGYSKVGADAANGIILARFHFPEVARVRYAAVFEQLARQTGWQVQVPSGIHQQALIEAARRVVPAGLRVAAVPSVYVQRCTVQVQCQGSTKSEDIRQAQQTFADGTGWQLTITGAQVLDQP